jgi:c-di-GMP-binding flagellar brake protein YcgR
MQAPNGPARILQNMDGELSRRQYVRVAVTLPVEFSVDGEPKPHDGSVFDLGAGGMRLVATYDVPARANVGLKFQLPGTERTVQARGRVVLSFFARNEKKFHHGIAFTSIEPGDRTAIVGFVETSDAQRRA